MKIVYRLGPCMGSGGIGKNQSGCEWPHLPHCRDLLQHWSVLVFLLHAQFLDTSDFPELHTDDDDEADNEEPENGQAFIDDIALVRRRGKNDDLDDLVRRPGGRGVRQEE